MLGLLSVGPLRSLSTGNHSLTLMKREELPSGKTLEKVAHRKNTFKEEPNIWKYLEGNGLNNYKDSKP
jgi:hypothetical protein